MTSRFFQYSLLNIDKLFYVSWLHDWVIITREYVMNEDSEG